MAAGLDQERWLGAAPIYGQHRGEFWWGDEGRFGVRVSDDPAAADYFVAVVEHGGLAGCDGALRVVERGDDFGGASWFERGRGRLVAMADLDLHAHGPGESGDADPVEAAGAQGASREFGIGAHGDPMAGRIDL